MNKDKDYSLLWWGIAIVIFLSLARCSGGSGGSDNPQFPYDDSGSGGDAIDYAEGQSETYRGQDDECALHPERCQPIEPSEPIYIYDPPLEDTRTVAVVTAKGLNIRSGPGADYADVGDLRRCDMVVVIGQDGAWVQIEGGYVHGDYITYDTSFCGSAQSEREQPQAITGCPDGCSSHLTGCDIKGNISVSTREKIYHVPGGEFYDSATIDPTYGERWFCTEDEAIANGWRRSLK